MSLAGRIGAILIVLTFATGARADEPAKDELTYQGQNVAEWMKKLRDSDPKTRLLACQVLRYFGPEAKAAVPALLDACHCSLPAVRKAAMEALKAVDPEAAKKAGVR